MSASPERVSPAQAILWLEAGEAVLIDVREPAEFAAEHIPYALSLPLGSLSGGLEKIKIPAGRKVIFQCLSGMRAGQACAMAGQAKNGCAVYNLEGGITGWKRAGHAVMASQDTAPARLSIFRQVQVIVGLLVLACVSIGLTGQPWGFVLAGIFGGALAFAGLSGWCGLALLLAKAPWNRVART